ncbi:MAG TPA: flagellar hook-length control protein FliK [Methylophilaceae bacterium]
MMQNLPLLNANSAPKAHVSGPTRLPAASADQTAETGTFQQKLAHQLGKHDETRQPGRQVNDDKNGATRDITETSDKAHVDLVQRKLKLQQLRVNLRENPAEEKDPGAVMPGIAFAPQAADVTMNPESADILAQIRQSTADDGTRQETIPEQAVLPTAQSVSAALPATDGVSPSANAITDMQPAAAVEQKPGTAADAVPALETDTEPPAFTAERLRSNEPEPALPDQQGRIAMDALGMQQARPATVPSTGSASPANAPIMTPPGTEGWNQAIGQRILWMVGTTQQSATLTLNPPEMGTLQIIVHVQNDKTDASFFSDRPEVRQALQDGMDNLREMMREAGISLGQTSIGQRDRAEQEARRPHTAHDTDADHSADEAEAMPAASRVRVGRGLVDTFA